MPGGSSSGSAVAVGAGLADFSLGKVVLSSHALLVFSCFNVNFLEQNFLHFAGTDTGGSVRVPASYCGIFGFRPSHDVISTSGVIPMAQSFDTIGKEINRF